MDLSQGLKIRNKGDESDMKTTMEKISDITKEWLAQYPFNQEYIDRIVERTLTECGAAGKLPDLEN